jgi:hypothetical protein
LLQVLQSLLPQVLQLLPVLLLLLLPPQLPQPPLLQKLHMVMQHIHLKSTLENQLMQLSLDMLGMNLMHHQEVSIKLT